MLMIGNAKDWFDKWEADKDTTDGAKLYREPLTKVKDYSRKIRLYSSVCKNTQHGSHPANVASIRSECHGECHSGDWWGGEIDAGGSTTKLRARAKENCVSTAEAL